ncbi:MAG: polymer-forming cytoskeletal protein [Candidatus Cryosericum sp.]
MAFGPSKTSTESKTASVFAHDLVVKGDVDNKGDLRIEGQLQGNVTGHGTITVAEQGEVHGNVEGRQVIVMGCVEGSVKGAEKVEVLEKATVKGDVTSARISVEEGASVSGKFDTTPREVEIPGPKN